MTMTERRRRQVRQGRAKMMLDWLPNETDPEWDRLSGSEQDFLLSIRVQFAQTGELAKAQYQALERIWEKG